MTHRGDRLAEMQAKWKQKRFNEEHLAGAALVDPIFTTEFSVSSDTSDDPNSINPMHLWRAPQESSSQRPNTIVMAQDVNQQAWVQVHAFLELSQEDLAPEVIIPLVDSFGLPLIDPCRPPAIHQGRWDAAVTFQDRVTLGVAAGAPPDPVVFWHDTLMGVEINTSWGDAIPVYAPQYEFVKNESPFPHWDLRIRIHYRTDAWPTVTVSPGINVIVDALGSPGSSLASNEVFEVGSDAEHGHYKILIPWVQQEHFAPVNADAFNSPQYGISGVGGALPQAYTQFRMTSTNVPSGNHLFMGPDDGAAWLGELPAAMVFAEGFPKLTAPPPSESAAWLTTLCRGMNGQTIATSPIDNANFNQSAYGSRVYWDTSLSTDTWTIGVLNAVANNQNQANRSYVAYTWGRKRDQP